MRLKAVESGLLQAAICAGLRGDSDPLYGVPFALKRGTPSVW